MSIRSLAWLAWSLAAISVAMFAAGGALYVLARFMQETARSWGALGELFLFVPFLAFPIVGALIASRRPRNPIGWICLAAGFIWMLIVFMEGAGAYWRLAAPGSSPYLITVRALTQWIWIPSVGLLGIYLILLFPDGKLPSRRWRPLAWLAGAVMVLASLGITFAPGPLEGHPGVRNPFGLEGHPWIVGAAMVVILLFALCILASALSLVVRYRRSGVELRQQIKWIAFAASVVGLGYLITLVSEFILVPEALTGAGSTPLWVQIQRSAVMLSYAGVPIAVGIAVLKYRLYDIDLIINRTLLYGALTATVVGIYILVVGYLGALFRTGGNLFISLVATGIVAVLFAPLRDRLQRTVNRLMYGERDDPYAVLSRLGQRLESTLAPEEVLPIILQTVKEALKTPYAAISLAHSGASSSFSSPSGIAASVGMPTNNPLRLALTYQSEPVGEFLVGERSAGETFSAADRRLLEGLARQAGVAVHAVRLTTDLQRSRERLVAAREEERRRLRRDLHDGLGAQLAALNVQAGTIRRLIEADPKAAEEMVAELREELRGAISEIRRLVYDLRPPALDDLGLIGALHQLSQRYGSDGESSLRVGVEAPQEEGKLPAAVEVAVYRITQEALTNVARHAKAGKCVVRLAVVDGASGRGELVLQIEDDGVGIPEGRSAGVGLSSMRERAAELGGRCVVERRPEGAGTRVLVWLPLSKE